MIFGYTILITALLLSLTAAYYSVMGLTAIFAAATVPVIIMGSTLELGKVVATVWLHNNWKRAPILFKTYLIPAVTFLMLLTSMGIFGYLSKAHLDQNIPSGDAQSKVAIYDEKIKTARDNIESARKALKQMDESVDQQMARSTDENGAQRAAALRRSQAKERGTLQADIQKNQTDVAKFNEERAPLAAEFRKIEAEVGPIKYIAALLYGDNPDANLLEKAVRFVIIMIVLVFDPLALCLILAANKQFEWARQGTGGFVHDEPAEPKPKNENSLITRLKKRFQKENDTPEEDNSIATRLKKRFRKQDNGPDFEGVRLPNGEWIQTGPAFNTAKESEYEPDDGALTDEQIRQINALAAEYAEYPETELPEVEETPADPFMEDLVVAKEPEQAVQAVPEASVPPKVEPEEVPEAIPGKNRGVDMSKMFTGLTADNQPKLGKASSSGFGNEYPTNPEKGDVYLRTDFLPNRLYKFNGFKWIEVDKDQTDIYAYNDLYIQHLINEIDSGRYDPESLTDIERQQIAEYLGKNA
jgi:hypothetical protein